MQPYRREKLASTIQVLLSEAIRTRLSDPRIEPLTSISRVEVSADLLTARVFIIVHGPSAAGRRTLAGLQHASGHLQSLLAGSLHVRQCPRISFELDEAFTTAEETLRLIAQNRRDRGDPTQDPQGGADPDEVCADRLPVGREEDSRGDDD